MEEKRKEERGKKKEKGKRITSDDIIMESACLASICDLWLRTHTQFWPHVSISVIFLCGFSVVLIENRLTLFSFWWLWKVEFIQSIPSRKERKKERKKDHFFNFYRPSLRLLNLIFLDDAAKMLLLLLSSFSSNWKKKFFVCCVFLFFSITKIDSRV